MAEGRVWLVPALFGRETAVEQRCVEVAREGVHALFECATVVSQRTVPRITSMEFVSALTAKTHLHVVGHVLEQRMEEHHRHVGIFAVPGKFCRRFSKAAGSRRC